MLGTELALYGFQLEIGSQLEHVPSCAAFHPALVAVVLGKTQWGALSSKLIVLVVVFNVFFCFSAKPFALKTIF